MALFRLAFGGGLYNDEWECGIYLAGTSGGLEIPAPVTNDAAYQQVLNDVQQDVTKWFQSCDIIGAATLNYVKFNEIDPQTKRYMSKTDSHEYAFDTPIHGSATNYTAPAQLSYCVSLLTGVKRGPASRGRFYPPPTRWTASLDANGRFGESYVTSYLNNCKTLIEDLGNWPGIDHPITQDLEVVVFGKGAVAKKVTQVAVGDVVDTQRRRRNHIGEKYYYANVTQ